MHAKNFILIAVISLLIYSLLLLLLLSRFSHVRLCATPQTAAHQAPPSMDSSGKNTGVGCHFLLQCMKVKSESEVAQWCLTLSDPMDCSLPGSPCPWDFPGKSTEVGCHCLLRYILSLYLFTDECFHLLTRSLTLITFVYPKHSKIMFQQQFTFLPGLLH